MIDADNHSLRIGATANGRGVGETAFVEEVVLGVGLVVNARYGQIQIGALRKIENPRHLVVLGAGLVEIAGLRLDLLRLPVGTAYGPRSLSIGEEPDIRVTLAVDRDGNEETRLGVGIDIVLQSLGDGANGEPSEAHAERQFVGGAVVANHAAQIVALEVGIVGKDDLRLEAKLGTNAVIPRRAGRGVNGPLRCDVLHDTRDATDRWRGVTHRVVAAAAEVHRTGDRDGGGNRAIALRGIDGAGRQGVDLPADAAVATQNRERRAREARANERRVSTGNMSAIVHIPTTEQDFTEAAAQTDAAVARRPGVAVGGPYRQIAARAVGLDQVFHLEEGLQIVAEGLFTANANVGIPVGHSGPALDIARVARSHRRAGRLDRFDSDIDFPIQSDRTVVSERRCRHVDRTGRDQSD